MIVSHLKLLAIYFHLIPQAINIAQFVAINQEAGGLNDGWWLGEIGGEALPRAQLPSRQPGTTPPPPAPLPLQLACPPWRRGTREGSLATQGRLTPSRQISQLWRANVKVAGKTISPTDCDGISETLLRPVSLLLGFGGLLAVYFAWLCGV